MKEKYQISNIMIMLALLFIAVINVTCNNGFKFPFASKKHWMLGRYSTQQNITLEIVVSLKCGLPTLSLFLT